MRFCYKLCVLFLFSSLFYLSADTYSVISKAFELFRSAYEGETGFRSLLIYPGGRLAGLNGAFTALSNDITFLESNPAGSATLKNTELAFFHNAWIADSHLDSFYYSMRTNHLGYGASLRCFYIPFTEYGSYGERLSSGYYSETFATFNISYNLFEGYKFKGMSLGASLKGGVMSFPPFQGQVEVGEESSTSLKKKNGIKELSFIFLADLGMQLRWDFFKKFDSRDPNMFFGLALKNIGPPIKGNIPPSQFSCGFAYQPIKILTFTFDAFFPINILNVKRSGKPFFSTGMMFSIGKYFNILSGLAVKGGNPSFTFGGELNFSKIQINANYTLDLSTQSTALNHIILGMKIILGDRGRAAREEKIERMYIEGLRLYEQKKYDEAIKVWEEVLKLNSYFEPAKIGIKNAKNMHLLQMELLKLEHFEY